MKWWAHSLQVFWKAKRISVSFLKQMKTSKSFFETGCHRINGFSPQHIKEPSIIYSLHSQWHVMYAWILHFFANWIWSLNLPSTSTLWCGFGARRWSIFHVFPSPESPGVNITHLYKTKKVYFLGLAMRLRNMRRSDICAEYSNICRICGLCGRCVRIGRCIRMAGTGTRKIWSHVVHLPAVILVHHQLNDSNHIPNSLYCWLGDLLTHIGHFPLLLHQHLNDDHQL